MDLQHVQFCCFFEHVNDEKLSTGQKPPYCWRNAWPQSAGARAQGCAGHRVQALALAGVPPAPAAGAGLATVTRCSSWRRPGLASISGCRPDAGHQHQQLAQVQCCRWPANAVAGAGAGAGHGHQAQQLAQAQGLASINACRGWHRPPAPAPAAGAGPATVTRCSSWRRPRPPGRCWRAAPLQPGRGWVPRGSLFALSSTNMRARSTRQARRWPAWDGRQAEAFQQVAHCGPVAIRGLPYTSQQRISRAKDLAKHWRRKKEARRNRKKRVIYFTI